MNNHPFTPEETKLHRAAVLKNLILCAQTLVRAMNALQIPYGFDPSAATAAMSLSRPKEPPAAAAEVPDKVAASLLVDAVAAVSPVVGAGEGISLGGPELHLNRSNSHSGGGGDCGRGLSAGGGGGESEDLAETRCEQEEVANAARLAYERVKGKAKPFQVDMIEKYSELLVTEGVDYMEWLWGDSGVHLMTHLERITNPQFTPTTEDILQSHTPTETVTETVIHLNARTVFRVFDAGGQRRHRMSWAPYFDQVDAIVFVMAVGAYDQVCLEDHTSNRMAEALNLFGTICNHPVFKKTCMIVFLNKADLLKQKLEQNPLNRYFPNYQGPPGDFDSACQFFKDHVNNLNKYKEKQIITHVTSITDTPRIRSVLEEINRVILESRLEGVGM
ncbi:guanine nucleotide-binding protein subunit alpha [Podochytrium sp. JEL0797]|nr:guanine nucleotide-binding protein subunit alpha [Podochytrium sp. JEL0797]